MSPHLPSCSDRVQSSIPASLQPGGLRRSHLRMAPVRLQSFGSPPHLFGVPIPIPVPPVPLLVFLPLLWLGMAGCLPPEREGQTPPPVEQDLLITFLHTTDMHSRFLSYDFEPLRGDREMGLLPENAPFGGIARLATILERERAKAQRFVYLDSGDYFQGAPVFNFFRGEVEVRALSALGVDATVLGNHEFDNGVASLHRKLNLWARYPVLAANYQFQPRGEPRGVGMAELVQPYVILNVEGLKLGIIGMGNVTSMTSIGEGGNSLGITPYEEVQVLQDYIEHLEPQVDLVILNAHLGLKEDERMIRSTSGLDLVFGGHHHVMLNPPKVVEDASGRPVPLIHSSAFLKFAGRLDVVVRNREVVAHHFTVLPIDATVPEDPRMLELLEGYILEMNTRIDLKQVLAYAPQRIPRYGGGGGDSPLGNLVAEAMQRRKRVEADFALTNTLGIRADFGAGPISMEEMFNVFPFENNITKVMLSGAEVVEMLDYVAQRSSGRGCQSQAQVSGITFQMHCVSDFRQSYVSNVRVGDSVIVGDRDCASDPVPISGRSFEVAVNDYIARGGSGFKMLKVNTSQVATDISIRDAVMDWFRKLPTCEALCPEGSATCTPVDDCIRGLTCYHEKLCVDRPAHWGVDACYEVERARVAAGHSSPLVEAGVPGEAIRCFEAAKRRAKKECVRLPCLQGQSDGRIDTVFEALSNVRDRCGDRFRHDVNVSPLVLEDDDLPEQGAFELMQRGEAEDDMGAEAWWSLGETDGQEVEW